MDEKLQGQVVEQRASHATSLLSTPFDAAPRHTIFTPLHATPHHITPHHTTPHHTIPHHATPALTSSSTTPMTTPAPTTTTPVPTKKPCYCMKSVVTELVRNNITDYIPYAVSVVDISNMSRPENVEFTIQIELHDTNETLDLVANTIRNGIANMTKLEYKCINITVITPRQRRLLQIPNYITFLVVITISVEDIPASDSDHVFLLFVILIPSLFAIVIVCCIIFKCCKIQPPAGVNKNMSCPRYEFIDNPQHYEYPYDLRYINGFAQ